MLVRDYMTEKVFSIRLDKKLVAAGEIMSWRRCRHVPVIDATGELVGMVSHRDLLKASLANTEVRAEQTMHLGKITIKSAMQFDVRTVTPDTPIQEAARLMREGKFGCLPVVTGNRLVGIITEHDLLEIVERMPAPMGLD